ncbi:MAG: GNAT family N-acetyltransferase, partial [Lachnospiraceae bacterium]|nr:GNAT family N-acetyltransferase [Lachnospiraceae bacterium]
CTQDVPKLYEIYKEPEITRYMEDLYENMDEEIKYTQDYIKWHYGLYGFGMWIVTDKAGRIIGRAGFDQKEEKEPHLGFMIRKDMQRQGLAFEVCSALMEYAASHFDVPGIISLTHPQNTASASLLKKLGFTCKEAEDTMVHWHRRL